MCKGTSSDFATTFPANFLYYLQKITRKYNIFLSSAAGTETGLKFVLNPRASHYTYSRV